MLPPLIALLLSSSIIFNKEVSSKKSEVCWNINQEGRLIKIAGQSDAGITNIISDLAFQFQQYTSKDTKQDEVFSVIRIGNQLKAELISKNNTKTETYNVNNKIWVQDFSFGLKSFFVSDANECTFEIISPKDLVMRTMIATKEEIDFKTFNKVLYRARRVKVTLAGFYKKFWKAELWYDTKSLNLLYYKANEGPSTPYTILTVKELKT